jgi:hypothetical protein
MTCQNTQKLDFQGAYPSQKIFNLFQIKLHLLPAQITAGKQSPINFNTLPIKTH